MKTRKAIIAVASAALVVCLILFTMRAFYVLVALFAGSLIMGYRELWSLIRTGRMPPLDERVKENTGKAIRNGFIFFAVISIAALLVFSMQNDFQPRAVRIVSIMFLSTGAVYALSYLFYDRAEPRLGDRALKILRRFLLTAATALPVFILSVFLHNVVSGLLGVEEAVFFIIGVFLSPAAFAVGIIGCLVIFILGLVRQPPDRLPEGETG